MNFEEKFDIEKIKQDFNFEGIQKSINNIHNLKNGIENKSTSKILFAIVVIYFAKKYKQIDIPILIGILIGLFFKYKK